MSLTDVATAAGLARPTARRLLLTLEELGFVRSCGGMFELTPKVLTLGTAYVVVAGAVGHRPAAPRGAGRADRRVLVDGAARRQRHRLRRPGVGAEAHRAAGRRSARASRRCRPRRARCCWPPSPPDELDGRARRAQPRRAAAVHRPLARAAARRAHRGAGPRLGAGRRGAGAGRPLGRRPGAGRDRRGAGGHERDGARGGDLARAAAAGAPARCCCARPATSAPSGRCGSRARTCELRRAPGTSATA